MEESLRNHLAAKGVDAAVITALHDLFGVKTWVEFANLDETDVQEIPDITYIQKKILMAEIDASDASRPVKIPPPYFRAVHVYLLVLPALKPEGEASKANGRGGTRGACGVSKASGVWSEEQEVKRVDQASEGAREW
eukprot:CAMPEP_0181289778 /NCGR_PEP_ID=MMETSP1101-20121128/1067_1 /TAXON_ID=46948 /ORGANISM="Rhodomonas abbreviata, Strain Caron Lab Isolate" /LENGTH=136 /DNA_ID=CAMNT_0023394029 /DNA_START=268 /DNA_END=674 /DNA_ORIENTATION=+